MLLHNAKELDDDLGGGSQEDLSLASLLGVDDGLKAVSQNTHTNHCSTKLRTRDGTYLFSISNILIINKSSNSLLKFAM